MAPGRVGGPCNVCVRTAKWLPVIFIVAIVTWSYYAYVIQLNILTIESIIQKVFYLFVYHILLVMFIWSYWQTIFTEIGYVPKQFRLPPAELEAYECAPTEDARREVLERFVAKHGLPVANRTMTGDIRYCEKCCQIKPDRCHHCSVCGECVLKMDHHCPWVNNCVSFTNYKYFVLFLSYAFLYCIFVAATTLEYLIQFWKSDDHTAGKFHVLFVFFVAIMFAISLISLLGYHIFLIFKNRSTVESFRAPIFHINHSWLQDKEGFSLGAQNNFLEVFGSSRRHWFLPVFTSAGDGVQYPMRFDRLQEVEAGHSTSTNTTTSPPPPPPPSLHHLHYPPSSSTSTSPSPPSYGSTNTNSLGDGVSYPQRLVEEDMDGLLGGEVTDWGDGCTIAQYRSNNEGGSLEEVIVQNNHSNPV